MQSELRARLQLLAAAAIFSTGGAAIKSLSLTGAQVACLRSGVAALVLFALIPDARRNLNRRTALVGLAYAATVLLFVLANKLTTSANAIFLQSSAPFYIVLIAPLCLRERVKARDLLFLSVLAGGLLLFFIQKQPALATATDPDTGNLLAVLSGVAWAFNLTGLRWLGRRPADEPGSSSAQEQPPPRRGGEAIGAVALGNVFAFLIALPSVASVESVSTLDVTLILYLGAIQIAAAYLLVTSGLRHVSALAGSFLLLLEPVLNPVWAWLIHGEFPGVLPLAGGAVLIAGALFHSWLSRKD